MECAACQAKTRFGSTYMVIADRMWCSDRAAFYGDLTATDGFYLVEGKRSTIFGSIGSTASALWVVFGTMQTGLRAAREIEDFITVPRPRPG